MIEQSPMFGVRMYFTIKFGDIWIGNILLENTGLWRKDCLRERDFTFSYMGSELVVFLTAISAKIDAARVAEKLKKAR